MNWHYVVSTTILLASVRAVNSFASELEGDNSQRPNVVIMLADDMGYGELQCLNSRRGKIKTPRLDAIAASGISIPIAAIRQRPGLPILAICRTPVCMTNTLG